MSEFRIPEMFDRLEAPEDEMSRVSFPRGSVRFGLWPELRAEGKTIGAPV